MRNAGPENGPPKSVRSCIFCHDHAYAVDPVISCCSHFQLWSNWKRCICDDSYENIMQSSHAGQSIVCSCCNLLYQRGIATSRKAKFQSSVDYRISHMLSNSVFSMSRNIGTRRYGHGETSNSTLWIRQNAVC